MPVRPRVPRPSASHKQALARPLLCATVLAVAGCGAPPPSADDAMTSDAGPPRALGAHVLGNQLVGPDGRALRLLGVDHSGGEYACAQGWGFFDGPTTDAAAAAIASWRANAVRLPLNEDCWLGINGVKPAYAGAAYRNAVQSWVETLHRHGLYAILDLHWSAPGGRLATGQEPMADADHSPAFWSQVAAAFKDDSGVLFDLYNEPYLTASDVAGPDSDAWSCWRSGCTDTDLREAPGTPWQAAGMQSLLDAVRQAGATQPVLLGGLGYASDLSQWLAHEPADPLGQIVASFHSYDFAACSDTTCWDATVAPVARQVPVVTGEIGENDCGHGYVDAFMGWADAMGVSYLAWTWNQWGCPFALIADYGGTPTSSYGADYREHLAQVAH